jgi:hypothetical protein
MLYRQASTNISSCCAVCCCCRLCLLLLVTTGRALPVALLRMVRLMVWTCGCIRMLLGL